jgi:hypothetical protein
LAETEYQVHQQKNHHQHHWYECRVKSKTFSNISIEQSKKGTLHPAAGAGYSEALLIEAGQQVVFEPVND